MMVKTQERTFTVEIVKNVSGERVKGLTGEQVNR